ncbi:hypothetical protein GCM10010969_23180 [Saccharibacillus kuerlensis]|uniref:Uncharacterized protein n=1 Tax=Saccharibacillus kuerlensis TaxID=459527 RepID=A0ABQ2L3E1_9BACL|nr:hypothetical protein GCM10010969_23180 [Saccharibacillus kuerlensis]
MLMNIPTRMQKYIDDMAAGGKTTFAQGLSARHVTQEQAGAFI